MARVSQKTIDLIKDTADIVDVVSEFVPLQTAGKNMKGLCPFHSEKTPSFFVSKERQIFNCFGCGKKGNVFTFIQEYKHVSFVESLEYLADKYHIDLELEHYSKQRESTTNLYRANERALEYFSLNLMNLESGKPALDYLLDRGLTIQTIEQFELGYAANKSTALLEHLSNDYQALDLMNAGLVNRNKEGEFYDLFRNRIIFPIRDEQNRIIGFSGRIFNDSTNPAKYVNTPYTSLFSKGITLYNLYRAAPYIRTSERTVLMEGYMDVIKASMAGVKEAICSMGTQLTIDQALKIKQFTEHVIICYDGDKAGQEATYKAIKLLEKAKLNVTVVSMPYGLDPDDYISKHDDFQSYVNNNQIDQYEFVYQMILTGKNLTKPIQIEQAKVKLFEFFSKTSGMIREIYFKRFATEANITYDTLLGDYHQTKVDEKIMQDYQSKIQRTKQQKAMRPRYLKAEVAVLNYYLKDVEYRDIIENHFKNLRFQNQEISSIMYTATSSLNPYPNQPVVVLKSKLSESYQHALETHLYQDYNYNIEDLESCIRMLEIANLEEEKQDMLQQAKTALEANDMQSSLEYYEQARKKSAQILKLERRTNGQPTNY